MATILVLTELYAGGPGSGCQGPNCGRPATGREERRAGLKKELEQTRLRLKIKRGQPGYVKKHNRENLKVVKKGLQVKLRYDRKEKKAPGLVRRGGKLAIPVKPVWKGSVKKQFTTPEGHKITILKQPKEYEKSGMTWINKPSSFKGQFHTDKGDFIQRSMENPKERNSFWIHQASPDKGVSIELHRNMGELRVKVIERELGQYDAIVKHRQVEFNNIGRASGFLNQRYGITFKLRQKRL